MKLPDTIVCVKLDRDFSQTRDDVTGQTVLCVKVPAVPDELRVELEKHLGVLSDDAIEYIELLSVGAKLMAQVTK